MKYQVRYSAWCPSTCPLITNKHPKTSITPKSKALLWPLSFSIRTSGFFHQIGSALQKIGLKITKTFETTNSGAFPSSQGSNGKLPKKNYLMTCPPDDHLNPKQRGLRGPSVNPKLSAKLPWSTTYPNSSGQPGGWANPENEAAVKFSEEQAHDIHVWSM